MGKGTKILSVRLTDGKATVDMSHVKNWADTNTSVLKWFRDNQQIKISAICQEAGVNQGNLSTGISKGQISEENLGKIIKVISKYGYKK